MASEYLSNLFNKLKDIVVTADFPEYNPIPWLAEQTLSGGDDADGSGSSGVAGSTGKDRDHFPTTSSATHHLYNPTSTFASQLNQSPYDPYLLRLFASNAIPSNTDGGGDSGGLGSDADSQSQQPPLRHLQSLYQQILSLPSRQLLQFVLMNNDSLSFFKQLLITHESKVLRYHAWYFFASTFLLQLWIAIHDDNDISSSNTGIHGGYHGNDIESSCYGMIESQRDVILKKEEVIEFIHEMFQYVSQIVSSETTVPSYNPNSHGYGSTGVGMSGSGIHGTGSAGSGTGGATNASEFGVAAKATLKPNECIEDNLYTINLFINVLLHLLKTYHGAYDYLDSYVDAMIGQYGSHTEHCQLHTNTSTNMQYRHNVYIALLLQQSIITPLLLQQEALYLLINRCYNKQIFTYQRNLYVQLVSQLCILLAKQVAYVCNTHNNNNNDGGNLIDLEKLTIQLVKIEKQFFLMDDKLINKHKYDLTKDSRVLGNYPLHVKRFVEDWICQGLRSLLRQSAYIEEKVLILKDLLVLIQYQLCDDVRELVSD